MNARSETYGLRLLEVLLEAEEAIGIERLCEMTGIGLDRIDGELEALRSSRCVIDETAHAVRLRQTSIHCWSEFLEARHVNGIGKRVLVYRETTSTQDVARELAESKGEGAVESVVVADHQTAGRGRLGRRWVGTVGESLLFTVIVSVKEVSVDRLVLGSCIALARTIEALTSVLGETGVPGVQPEIKWPNDVLVDGKKIAGILVEARGDVGLIGFGINVHQANETLGKMTEGVREGFGFEATSLRAEGVSMDRLRLLDDLLSQLDRTLGEESAESLHEAWKARSCLLQHRIGVECDGRRLEGRVIDIDPAQGLLLEVERGPVTILPAATTSIVSVE